MIIYFVDGKLNDTQEEIDHPVILFFHEDEVYMNTFHKNEFKYMGRMKSCNCGSGLDRRELYDARNIFVGFYCDECEEKLRSKYRPEIFKIQIIIQRRRYESYNIYIINSNRLSNI